MPRRMGLFNRILPAVVAAALLISLFIGCRSKNDAAVSVGGRAEISRPPHGDIQDDDISVTLRLAGIDPSDIRAILVHVLQGGDLVKEEEVPFRLSTTDSLTLRLPVAGLKDGERYLFTLFIVTRDGVRLRVTPDMDIRLALGLTVPIVDGKEVRTFDPRHTFLWRYASPPVGDRVSFSLEGLPNGAELLTGEVDKGSTQLTPEGDIVSEEEIAAGRDTVWRLRMVSRHGVLGPPSEEGSVTFTVDLPPVEARTANGGMPSVVALPGLLWRSIPGAVRYHVEIAGGGGGDFTDGNALRRTTPGSRYRIGPEELEVLLRRNEAESQRGSDEARNIYWRVRAENTLGNTTEPSDPFRFVYDHRMPTMEVVLPAAGVGTPRGVVVLGAPNAPEMDESPTLAVNLSRGFVMARFEATNGVVAGAMNNALLHGEATIVEGDGGGRYIVDTNYRYPLIALDDLDFGSQFSLTLSDAGILAPVNGYVSHPATGITWYGAAFLANELSLMEARDEVYEFTSEEIIAHHEREGYRLPTEGEWAFAASLDRRINRTGPEAAEAPVVVTEARTIGAIELRGINYERSGHRWEDLSPPHTRAGGPTVPVGALGYLNPAGLSDMVGNVWEWTENWYDPEWYARATAPDGDPVADGGPELPVPDVYGREMKVVRGTAWNTPREDVRVTNRGAFSPDATSHSIGVRFARTIAAPAGTGSEGIPAEGDPEP